jgi:hypothetical protein
MKSHTTMKINLKNVEFLAYKLSIKKTSPVTGEAFFNASINRGAERKLIPLCSHQA